MNTQIMILILGLLIGLSIGYLLTRFWEKIKQLPNILFTAEKNPQDPQEHTPLSSTSITDSDMAPHMNLLHEKINFDMSYILELLDQYRREPTLLIEETLHRELSAHDEMGNNVLHVYLQHEHVEVETVETMIELEPELLTEANAEGDTALHIAERNEHFEVAEWMLEPERFESAEERHHFLAHQNHHGHTALHDVVHLWHYHPPHNNHFFHMLTKHPTGALMWHDAHGKTVYEHFFEHPDANRHKLLETLEHKGVIHKHGDHYELSHEAEEKVREAVHLRHATSNLNELLVKDYAPPQAKKDVMPTTGTKDELTETERGGARGIRIRPL